MKNSAVPAWAITTPEERTFYQLVMSVESTGHEVLTLSRQEYVGLKKRLAELRGFSPGHLARNDAGEDLCLTCHSPTDLCLCGIKGGIPQLLIAAE